MMYLIDTNVVSETQVKRPMPSVLRWLADTPSQRKFVSVLSLGELRRGIEVVRRGDAPRARKLDRWFVDVVDGFGNRIIGVDASIAARWGHLGIPDRHAAVDSLIAATALVHGLTVATR